MNEANPMDIKMIGIAGGSGSGKSTAAISLCRKHPDSYAVVHLDDYFKKKEDAVMAGDVVNWDHPDSLLLDDLYADLAALKEGRPVTVMTKSELYHPEYDYGLKNRKEYTIEPKPVIIVEGYLVLHDARIRGSLDLKVYLDMSIEESVYRRSANKFPVDAGYLEKILLPMHERFVEPTKACADLVIDVVSSCCLFLSRSL